MGLDSVELLIEWEKFFGINIPDNISVSIITVENAVDAIAERVVYKEGNRDLKKLLTEHLNTALSESNLITEPLSINQKIFDLLPAPVSEKNTLVEISNKLDYELPYPFMTGTFGKFMNKILPTKVSFRDTTVDRFIDLTAAVNYKKILSSGDIQNKYEIKIAVWGITIEKIGINPYEIYSGKSFVNDFGID